MFCLHVLSKDVKLLQTWISGPLVWSRWFRYMLGVFCLFLWCWVSSSSRFSLFRIALSNLFSAALSSSRDGTFSGKKTAERRVNVGLGEQQFCRISSMWFINKWQAYALNPNVRGWCQSLFFCVPNSFKCWCDLLSERFRKRSAMNSRQHPSWKHSSAVLDAHFL